MIERRALLAGSAAALALAGCGAEPPPGPGTLTVRAQAGPGANPGPDGSDRPLTLTVVQLDSPAAFQAADFFALQDPSAALGASLLQSDRIVLPPGESASRAIAVQQGAQVIGVIANYRSPAGKTFRATTAAPASGNAGLIVSVGADGVALRSA